MSTLELAFWLSYAIYHYMQLPAEPVLVIDIRIELE